MNKKTLRITAILLALFLLLPFANASAVSAQTSTAPSGSGTLSDPYRITTIDHLDFLRQNTDKCYRLENDLDFSGIPAFQPLPAFGGRFDGNGKTIANLTINQQDSEGGFFIGVSGLVTNLTFTNANVTANAAHAGIVAGYLEGNGAITTVNILGGTVKMAWRYAAVGSIVGRMVGNSTISSCNSNATVTNASSAGGLVGLATDSTLVNSYFTGSVTGKDYAGGLIGQETGVQVIRCFATGTVSGATDAAVTAGLFGRRNLNAGSTAGDIDTCYWDVTATGQTQAATIDNEGAPSGVTGLEGMTGIQIPAAINVTPASSPKQIPVTTLPSTAAVSGTFSTVPYYSGVTVTSTGAVTAVYNGTYPVYYTLSPIGNLHMVMKTEVTVTGAQAAPSTLIMKTGSEKLLFNGEVSSTINNVQPMIVDSLIYVPLRTAAQTLGLTVSYNVTTNSTIVTMPNGKYVSTTGGSNRIDLYSAGGILEESKTMPGNTFLLNSTSYVPISFFSLGFAYQTESRTYTGGDTYILISTRSPQWAISQVSDLIEDAMDKIS